MPVKGLQRYKNLFSNISNPGEYLFRRSKRKTTPLEFLTKPSRIRFSVPAALYHVFKEIFMEDFYEIRSLVKKLPAKPVVIDIGANAGYFEILLLSKLPGSKIYAFEPLPSNIQLSAATADQNEIVRSQVQFNQYAVTGVETDTVNLFTEATSDNSVVASVFSSFDERNTRSISVPAKSFGQIISGIDLSTIDLLKLDCEGSEYDIIYNTKPELVKRFTMMVIEVHELDGKKNNLAALTAYLNELGYRTSSQPVTETSYYLEAIKRKN